MAQTDVLDLLDSIAEQCREVPQPTLVRNYIDTCRDFCKRTRWLRKTVTGMVTAAGQITYTITADADNDFCGVIAIDLLESVTETRQLVEQNADLWDPDADNDMPERWQYVVDGQFSLDPPPAAAYGLIIHAVMRPKKAATTIDSRLADECDQAIEFGVVARLKAIQNMPWSDPGGARDAGRAYDCEVGSYSILADRGNNAGGRVNVDGGPANTAIRSRILKL